MAEHRVPPSAESPAIIRPIVVASPPPTPLRGRAGQPVEPPELIERLAPLATRIRHMIGGLDGAVRSSNLLTLGADLELAHRDARDTTDSSGNDGRTILDVLGTLQHDTTQAVVGLDGVVSLLDDVEHLIRRVTGLAGAGTAPPDAAEPTSTPDGDVVRTLDGAARVLALQGDAFRAIASRLDGARAIAGELVRASDELAAALGTEPAMVVEAVARTAQAAHVTSICFAHLAWRNELVRGVAAHAQPAVETDPTKCSLGSWLEAHQPRSGDEVALVERIRPLHERFHRAAEEILDQIGNGAATSTTLALVEREVAPCFAAAWACLIELVALFQASAAAAVSALRSGG